MVAVGNGCLVAKQNIDGTDGACGRVVQGQLLLVVCNVASHRLQIWNTEPLDIDDWGIASQDADELELNFLSCTPEQGDITDAKNH